MRRKMEIGMEDLRAVFSEVVGRMRVAGNGAGGGALGAGGGALGLEAALELEPKDQREEDRRRRRRKIRFDELPQGAKRESARVRESAAVLAAWNCPRRGIVLRA